ncbi:TonB-dependent receptor [Parahaliea mediterranea]|uniref:TonB-dependent receptor n=1 Tax=Parahaliea mediterranea TaxID=651086 RepID=A0A939IM39_9GAMM|nr:TonB-dependent receptor [Parahaliea mediterranea]MBN7799021.1 TonB-dependent receptor [Parahaliea mediterranea]
MLTDCRRWHRSTRSALWGLLAIACADGSPAMAGDNRVADRRPGTGESTRFAIDASSLSGALIQYSQQSGQPIVFSDRLTRHLPATPLIGGYGSRDALDMLLEDSGLDWELIDGRIIAVYRQECDGQDCDSPRDTVSNNPVYEPGIEETYVYGSRLTGSRIRRTDYSGSAPVDVFRSPDIELSGAQSLGELLRFVPAVVGNSTSTAIANGGDGTASVTLRGLPASNTLILINGRRVANDGLAGESVDLNSIPPAAVERIEILKDSASAIYGSDAIAGVVNVIMKQDFRGLLAETYYGETERGDLETRTNTLQYGTGLPNGSLFLSASHYEQEPIFSRDRAVSASADTRALGGTDLRSSATSDTRVVLADGRTLIADGAGYRPAGPDDLFDYQAYTTAVVPLERTSLYGNAIYDFTERITGLVEFTYLETEAASTLAPTPVFTAFEQSDLTISADNIHNPFGEDITDARRRLVEFPERRQLNESEVIRFVAAVEGLYDDWNWDAGYTWSRSEASQITRNLVNADRLQRALGPAAGCLGAEIDGCTPVDLLGPAGSITPEQVDYIRADGRVSGYSELSSISFNVSNALLHLPAGRGDVAFGVEYRQESTDKRPDDLLASAATLGATNFEATRGKRKITEFYAESVLPVWRSPSEAVTLHLEGAIRHSNYSDFGDSTNPKLGLLLQLGSELLLRASYSRGFRAPSLNELYEGETEEQAFIDDPCTRPGSAAVLPGCNGQADPSRNQFLTVQGGNPALEPETSHGYSAGFVWTPAALGSLRLSLDLFEMEQEDVVSSSAQFIVRQNALYGSFAEDVTRDEMGNLVLVRATNINVGQRLVRGADLGLTYHFPRDRWGQFSLNGNATYLGDYRARTDAAAPEIDFAGTFRDEASEGLGGIPQWKWQLGLRWHDNRWRASADLHHVSSMKEQLPGTGGTRTIDSWTVMDMQLSYTFDVLEGLRLSLGVDNALDEDAPLAASAFNDNIDGRTHELKGRYWYTRLSQRF